MPAGAACAVGLLYAAVSAYWAAGGTQLLNTVGGVFEEAGRSGALDVALLIWLVVMVKVVAAALPLAAVAGSGPLAMRRLTHTLAWLKGAILTGYGLILTVVGLLVEARIIAAGSHADHLALRWHAYLWDPWFLLWGLLVLGAMFRSHAARNFKPGSLPAKGS